MGWIWLHIWSCVCAWFWLLGPLFSRERGEIEPKKNFRKRKMTENELFLNRTDELAKRMRLTLGELLPIIDLSKGAFSGYRTGRLPISSKAWRKLEAAEKAVGIGLGPEPLAPKITLEEVGGDRLERLETELGGMREEMARLAAAVEALLEAPGRAANLIIGPWAGSGS